MKPAHLYIANSRSDCTLAFTIVTVHAQLLYQALYQHENEIYFAMNTTLSYYSFLSIICAISLCFACIWLLLGWLAHQYFKLAAHEQRQFFILLYLHILIRDANRSIILKLTAGREALCHKCDVSDYCR